LSPFVSHKEKERAVGKQDQAVFFASGHLRGSVDPGGHGGLPIGIVAPCGHGSVRFESEVVIGSGGHCGNGSQASGYRRLATAIGSPSEHGSSAQQSSKAMGLTGSDGLHGGQGGDSRLAFATTGFSGAAVRLLNSIELA